MPRARHLYTGNGNEHVRKKPEDPGSARDRRPNPRVPFRRPVRLPSARLQDFIEAATANISRSGMFVQGPRIPVGARFDFSITLGDGFSPVQGIGEVIWVSSDENGVSSGIGVHFLELGTAC